MPTAENCTLIVLSSPLTSVHVPAVPDVSAPDWRPYWPVLGVALLTTVTPLTNPAAEVSALQFVTGELEKF